jgi:surface antigen
MLKILSIGALASLTLAGCAGYRTTTRETVVLAPDGGQRQVAYADQRYDGCSDNEALGTVTGAVVGGVVGNQFGSGDGNTAATIGGVILGGIAGNAIARDGCRNDRADAYYYNTTYYDAFDGREYGQRREWRNPHNGNYGYITPIRNVRGDQYGYQQDCREFTQTVYMNGRPYEDTGVACRANDGTWRIVSS